MLTLSFLFSIRRRALDLLYGMCDVSNAKDIVEELLQVWTDYVYWLFYMNLVDNLILIDVLEFYHNALKFSILSYFSI